MNVMNELRRYPKEYDAVFRDISNTVYSTPFSADTKCSAGDHTEVIAKLREIDGDIYSKAENIAVYIKQLEELARELEHEENLAEFRKKTAVNFAGELKNLLLEMMDSAGLKKLGTPRASLSVREKPEALVISDGKKLIEWALISGNTSLLRFPSPEICRSAVRSELKNNTAIPYASLKRGRTLIIK